MAGAMLLGYITMTITVLIMFFSATVDSKVSRKSRSQRLSAARGVSKRHTEARSEEVGEGGSVQRVDEMSRLLTSNPGVATTEPTTRDDST
jgi:hypothetical protein